MSHFSLSLLCSSSDLANLARQTKGSAGQKSTARLSSTQNRPSRQDDEDSEARMMRMRMTEGWRRSAEEE